MSDERAGREGCNLTVGKRIYMTDDLSPLTEAISNIAGPILFFNIGYALMSGDAFAPFLGTMLQGAYVRRYGVAVMGTMFEYIGARDLPGEIERAKRVHKHRTIIAVDSACGRNAGTFSWEKGMLRPGAGLNKGLPLVGDYCLMFSTFEYIEGEQRNATIERMAKCDWNFVRQQAQRACDAIVAGLKLRKQRAKEVRQVASGRQGEVEEPAC